MPYFPFFIDVSEKKIIVTGSGKKAQDKVEKMKPFCRNIIVITSSEKVIGGECWERMLSDAFAVVAAEENMEANAAVVRYCREQKIPVNAVDNPEFCDFFFPSVISEGELSIGISTGVTVPAAAAEIRRRVEKVLPENIGELLAVLEKERRRLKTEVKDEKERSRMMREMVVRCLEKGCMLNKEKYKIKEEVK